MSDYTIAVGLPAAIPEWEAWLDGRAAEVANVLTDVVLYVSAVDEWIGVSPPPPEARIVHLRAPQPLPDEPPQWLLFHPFACWTTDLVAIRIPTEKRTT